MAMVYKVSTEQKYLGDTILRRQAIEFAVKYARNHNIPVQVTAQVMNTGEERTVAIMPSGAIVQMWS